LREQFLSSLRDFLSVERLCAWSFVLPDTSIGRFSAVRRHNGPELLRRNCGGHQVSHAHQL
jgi:hypothetical protein